MIAVDTNILTEMMRGTFVDIGEEYYVPYVVKAEVLSGVKGVGDPAKYEKLANDMLSGTSFVVSDGIGVDVLNIYTEITSRLQKKGTPVSPNDAWIAAECLALDLPFLTRDSDFDRIPDLMLA